MFRCRSWTIARGKTYPSRLTKKTRGAEAPRAGVAGRRRRQTPRTATIYVNERQAFGLTLLASRSWVSNCDSHARRGPSLQPALALLLSRAKLSFVPSSSEYPRLPSFDPLLHNSFCSCVHSVRCICSRDGCTLNYRIRRILPRREVASESAAVPRRKTNLVLAAP